uniref:Pectin acetylesterase n=1 Tax=Solanum tuberosum TaxID=4113 RepID=M1DCW6_SOLTU
MEGGGWCQNVAQCLLRKNSKYGSSAKMENQVFFSGMLSNEQKFNPEFYNWNRVFVRYCDGGSFTGDVEAIDPGTGLHYRGARIFKAIMEELLAQGMNKSENGSVRNLPPSCTSKLKPSLVRNILVPRGTDPKGAWNSCGANIKTCTPDQLKVLQGFRLNFLKALEGLGPSSTRGYYINSCFAHCQTQKQASWFGPNSPRLFNKTIAEAVGDWVLERNQFRQIDCPYPCDKTCG